jgi:hypothetical protein
MNDSQPLIAIRLHRLLHIVGGGLAGVLVSVPLLNSDIPDISLFVLIYGLAGASFGAFAGFAIRYEMPQFGRRHIIQLAGLLAAGFSMLFVIIFGIAPSASWLMPLWLLTIFVFPPVAGAVSGCIAKQWIATTGGFPASLGNLGWAVSAGLYVPLVLVVNMMINPHVAADFPPVMMFANILAGVVGGYLSGGMTHNFILDGWAWHERNRGKREQIAVAPVHDSEIAMVDMLAPQQFVGKELLEVVDEPFERKQKDKPKSKPLDLPLPQTSGQWRMALVAMVLGVLLTIGFASMFSGVSRNPQMLPPTPTALSPSFPTRAPAFFTGQPVTVYNLTPDVAHYSEWIVTEQLWLDGTEE